MWSGLVRNVTHIVMSCRGCPNENNNRSPNGEHGMEYKNTLLTYYGVITPDNLHKATNKDQNKVAKTMLSDFRVQITSATCGQ